MAGYSNLGELQVLLAAGGLPELGPGPRPQVLPREQLEKPLENFLSQTNLSSTARDLIRAVILLWHDRLDAAHEIAQGIENEDGSFVHGIVHRREPDFGNSRYWFRRTGGHAAFPALASKVSALLESANDLSLREKLIPDGEWDPFAFIAACEQAARKPASDPQVELLRKIQGIESEVLLEHFLNS